MAITQVFTRHRRTSKRPPHSVISARKRAADLVHFGSRRGKVGWPPAPPPIPCFLLFLSTSTESKPSFRSDSRSV
ncbi:hypothetical protein BDM02DRAFT_3114022 [Thelephora ganbajun]|uniref:Uncharacterized protein n=1 Tax=Thelephora ganbajun TaxID=370292 RepID=A0ACB6ZI50_THEGA|nr:hypothetical protein BDM02DRAFT_3114022 [Thelephora ganbajun]